MILFFQGIVKEQVGGFCEIIKYILLSDQANKFYFLPSQINDQHMK